MKLLFIKQGMPRNEHLETGIERAAAGLPGVEFSVADLPALYAAQEGPLRAPPYAARMRHAIDELLRALLREPDRQILLLNGFVLHKYHPQFFGALRRARMSVLTWQIDDPYYVDMNLAFAAGLDAVFSVDSSTLPLYRARGVKAEFLPLACDPELHRSYHGAAGKYACDVCFIGVPFAGSRRVRLFDELAGVLPRHDSRIIGSSRIDNWKSALARYEELKACVDDAPVGAAEAARYFAAARINLNIHKDSYGHAWDRNAARIEARSPAERSFAIAGCGGFQLVDDTRPDLGALFRPGAELVTFSGAADLAAKIGYYLAHEDERRDIARAAQVRAHAEHTYRRRLEALLAFL
jgi:spore maturation protein CgeB